MKKKEKEKEHERQKEIMTEHIQKHSRPNRNLRSDYWLSSGAKQKGKSIAKFFCSMAKDKVGKRCSGVCHAESSKDNVFSSDLSSPVATVIECPLGPSFSSAYIPLPRTYFEVGDIRPGEDEMQWIKDEIFVSTAGGISVPKGSTIWHQNGNECIRFHPIFLVPFSFFLVWYRTGSH